MPLFAVTWGYTTDISQIDAVRADHGAFIKKLTGDGTLKEAGAWADGTGALLIVDAEDSETLRAVLDADPYTTGGVVVSETVNEWAPVLGRLTA